MKPALSLPGTSALHQDGPPTVETASGARTWAFFVVGEPRAKGSKTAFVVKGKFGPRAVVTDGSSSGDAKRKLTSWNQSVTAAAMVAFGNGERIDAPVEVRMKFYFARPKGHYGTGKNAGQLKAGCPCVHAVKPDCDKVARSTLDALKVAMLFDDSRVWRCTIEKRYADGGQRTGCAVVVEVSL